MQIFDCHLSKFNGLGNEICFLVGIGIFKVGLISFSREGLEGSVDGTVDETVVGTVSVASVFLPILTTNSDLFPLLVRVNPKLTIKIIEVPTKKLKIFNKYLTIFNQNGQF